MLVNCMPVKGCVWPVIAPAQGPPCARGKRQSNSECGMRNSELGTRGMALSGILVCRRVIYDARKKHSAA